MTQRITENSRPPVGRQGGSLEYEDLSFEKMNFADMPSELKYLLEADNIVITPHIAGWTKESDLKHAQVLAEKILKDFK